MKKILVVDDSEVNLYLIQAIFENDPEIEVEIESDSVSALSKMERGLPDLLVLDLMMPGIDGFEMLENMYSKKREINIPVLIITARKDMDARNKVNKFGLFQYIQKPINLRETEEKIRSLLFSNASY